MKRDELNSLTNNSLGRYPVSKEKNKHEETAIFVNADAVCKAAAASGHYGAVVLTIPGFRSDLIELPPGCSFYPFTERFSFEENRHKLDGLGIECLKDEAAALKDYLISEGLDVILRIHIEGKGRTSAYYVWDMIAHW